MKRCDQWQDLIGTWLAGHSTEKNIRIWWDGGGGEKWRFSILEVVQGFEGFDDGTGD